MQRFVAIERRLHWSVKIHDSGDRGHPSHEAEEVLLDLDSDAALEIKDILVLDNLSLVTSGVVAEERVAQIPMRSCEVDDGACALDFHL